MKTKPIRILQCVSNMDRAGIETMLMNYYRNISKNEIQFDFIVNQNKKGDYAEEIYNMGGRIFVSPGLSPLKWFKYQKFMNDLFKKHPEYKIIHGQNEAMSFPALYAAKKNNLPVRIAHSHNTKTRFDFKWPVKFLYKALIKKVATKYVACSNAAGKYFFNQDVMVINNAIDSKKFLYNKDLRNKMRNKLGVNDKFVLGHVGRFEIQKNHEFLIEIFKEYVKINQDAILLLIGNGKLQETIKSKVNDYNLNEKVIFTGNIANVNEYYQAMDMFLLPSFHEGLPVVGVEAQASGLTCLFSNKITKEVNISNNCVFLDINNPLIWVKEIEKQKNNKRKNMQKVLIQKNYDIDAATEVLTNFYKNLSKAGDK